MVSVISLRGYEPDIEEIAEVLGMEVSDYTVAETLPKPEVSDV